MAVGIMLIAAVAYLVFAVLMKRHTRPMTATVTGNMLWRM